MRTVGDKDFIVLGNAVINKYSNNIVIKSENGEKSMAYLMNKYQRCDGDIIQSKPTDEIHIFSEDTLIIIKSPVMERIDFTFDKKLRINIISDKIEEMDPKTYMRKIKIEKIRNGRKNSDKCSD